MGTTTPNAWRDETFLYSVRSRTKTLLRFENCSSSHCLLSLWRHFHVCESSHPSFLRTVFFGAPLAFLPCSVAGLMPVVASFLRRRVVGSSFRRLRYILGRYLMYGDIYYTDFTCISYTFPFLLNLYLVALLPRYLVTLSLCYLVIPFPCYYVTLLL